MDVRGKEEIPLGEAGRTGLAGCRFLRGHSPGGLGRRAPWGRKGTSSPSLPAGAWEVFRGPYRLAGGHEETPGRRTIAGLGHGDSGLRTSRYTTETGQRLRSDGFPAAEGWRATSWQISTQGTRRNQGSHTERAGEWQHECDSPSSSADPPRGQPSCGDKT